MILELIEVGFLVSDYVYHRYLQHPDPVVNPGQDIKLPTARVGSSIPIFYGQCLIKTPVLAYAGKPLAYASGDGPASGITSDPTYALNMFFICGIPFSGFANVRLRGFYVGETQVWFQSFYPNHPGDPAPDDTGAGGIYSDYGYIDHFINGQTYPLSGGLPAVGNPRIVMLGSIVFLNGWPTQQMVSGSTPLNEVARAMLYHGILPGQIPGYRGYVSVGLVATFTDDDTLGFVFGTSAQPPALSFEMLSLPDDGGASVFTYTDGCDVNPMSIVYDLCTGTMGKLGLDPSRLDATSMTRCAEVLKTENFSMSIVWSEQKTAKEYLDDIMVHIDCVYYEDQTTGKLVFKLIRNDYNPFTLQDINPSNCQLLDDVAVSGSTDTTNKVRVTFTNRSDHYRDGTSTLQNLANAVGQDGQVREVSLSFPGITQQGLADYVCARELAARSKPLFKCRAALDGSFYRVNVGDVLRLDWPDANIANYVMRVASKSRGTLKDGTILVDLIQDFYYNWRNRPPLIQQSGTQSGGIQVFG